MRLIDADKLEEALHNFFDGKVIDEPTYILRDVFCYIDNAPTEFDDKAYSQGYAQGTIDTEHALERPRGKWCNTWDKDEYTCSNCHSLIVMFSLNNYCPNCGADMRSWNHGKK